MREPAKENAGTNGRRYSMNIPRVVVPRTTDPPGVIPRLLDREKLDLENQNGSGFDLVSGALVAIGDFDGQISLAFPPTFIFCNPSVQQGITRLSWKVAGSPRSTELSKTVPSFNVPV